MGADVAAVTAQIVKHTVNEMIKHFKTEKRKKITHYLPTVDVDDVDGGQGGHHGYEVGRQHLLVVLLRGCCFPSPASCLPRLPLPVLIGWPSFASLLLLCCKLPTSQKLTLC